MDAQQRIEQLEQQLQQELQQREKELQQVLQESEQKDQQIQKMEQRLQQTTLTEYLRLCHEHLSKSISIGTDSASMTKSGASNVKGQHRPDRLKPWEDYLKQHKGTLELLYSVYPPVQPRVFHSSDYLQIEGEHVAENELASRRDGYFFMHKTMGIPMTKIMQHLQSLAAVRDIFDLPQEFSFKTRGNSFSDYHLIESQAHQFCVYKNVEGVDKVVLVAEFKPPHKLPLKQLRCFLGSNRHETKLDAIINRIIFPSRDEKDAHDDEKAEEEVATVITRTFSYMIRSETQYGYISTGEALVFLHIKLENEMKTAYYYLAEPNGEDSGTDSNKQHTDSNPLVALHRTALAHIMTFSIHELKSANENNQWRERILPKLKTWVRTDHAVLDQTTPKLKDLINGKRCLESESFRILWFA